MKETHTAESEENAYQGALSFLYDRINYERMASGTATYPFRLKRMKTLLNRLGLERYLYRPGQPAEIPLVHLAGTKGKGSAASLVAAGLTAAGLKTGLYTSPHLSRLEERFRVDGQPCSRHDVIALTDRLREVAAELSEESSVGAPSFFELTTAMALLHFDRRGCDAVVLEVGLGGRLDSTNVCSPTVTGITSIGLDHQNVLGETIEEIAAEKAGIIKEGVPIVCGTERGPARDVIGKVARRHGAPLLQIGRDFSYQAIADDDWGSHVTYQSLESLQSQSFHLQLDGKHQAQNAAIAMAVIDVLGQQGVAVTRDVAARGFAGVQCAGRLERFRMPGDVIGIVDAAHNDDSIAALCDCLRHRCANRKISVVFGTSRDKNAEPMLAALAAVADRLVLTQFQGSPRFTPTSSLRSLLPDSMSLPADVIDDPIEACRSALESATPGGAMVVCGSFFLVAETRTWIADRSG